MSASWNASTGTGPICKNTKGDKGGPYRHAIEWLVSNESWCSIATSSFLVNKAFMCVDALTASFKFSDEF